MLRACFAVFLLIVLSGCSDGTGPKDGHESTTATGSMSTVQSSTSNSGSSMTPPIAELPFGLVLNDCRGIRAAYRFVADAPEGPEVPPGWESDGIRPTIIHGTFILACGHLSLGAFERGPIHVLFESHTNVNIPVACLDSPPATNYAEILRGIWFDDPEVAAFLAANWSMPVHVGEFTFSETTQQGASIFGWTWNESGSEPSSLQYGRTETAEGGNPLPWRYFWHDGVSAFMLDMVMDEHRPLATPPPVIGSLKPPMTPIDPYAGIFSLVDPGAIYTATLHKFQDLRCSEP